jgi:protein gp37
MRGMGRETWGPKGVRVPVADFSAKLRRLNKLCICDKCHQTQPFARVGKPCGLIPRQRTGTGLSALIQNTLADNECTGTLRRIRFFADSNSDWLDRKWKLDTFTELLNEIHLAPNVDVILLTKRPERWEGRTREAYNHLTNWPHEPAFARWLYEWRFEGRAHSNLWLGVSVENQEMANLRIPLLGTIPAAIRFLSMEPLLENVSLIPGLARSGPPVNWIIVGGESGKKRRDCGVAAIESVVSQAKAALIPTYVKQDCAFKSGEQGRIPDALWSLKQFPNPRREQILDAVFKPL